MKRVFCRKLTFVVSCSILAFSILGVMLVFATASENNHKHVIVNGRNYKYFGGIKEGYKSSIMTIRDGEKPLSSYMPSITTEHIDDSGYEVNSNGETYGSGSKEAILGVAPDLIKARGVDGTLGYVRSEDIEPEAAENLEEAVKMMERQKVMM